MSYFVEMLSQVPTINPIQSSQGSRRKVIQTAYPESELFSVAQVQLLFTKGMRLFSRQGHVRQLLIPFWRLFLQGVAPLCLSKYLFERLSRVSWEICLYPIVTSWLRGTQRDNSIKSSFTP